MACSCKSANCDGCPGRIICHCLQITEETVVTSIRTLGLQTVKEIRQWTGAGDGCTCCHKRLQRCLDEHATVETPTSVQT